MTYKSLQGREIRNFVEQVVRTVNLESNDSRFPENYRTVNIQEKTCSSCKAQITSLSISTGVCENCNNSLMFTDCCKVLPIDTTELDFDKNEVGNYSKNKDIDTLINKPPSFESPVKERLNRQNSTLMSTVPLVDTTNIKRL